MYPYPLLIAFLLFTFVVQGFAQDKLPGLKAGVKAPAFQLKDNAGKVQNFDSLKGKNGLLVLFFRSADWCPFCKQQVLQLAAAQQEFEAKGINVVGISYDSVDILAEFEQRHGLKVPLLSDEKSGTIRKFGILNPAATGFEVGEPYPGLYLIGADGVIKSRYFEQEYVNRYTPNLVYSILFQGEPLPAGEGKSIDAPHVKVVLAQSDKNAVIGDRVRLSAKIELPEGVHAYAPRAESRGYKVVHLTLEPNALYSTLPASYPAGTPTTFKALNETVPVYNGHAEITEDILLADKPIFRQVQTGQLKDVTVKGTLAVQACNESTCFSPQSIPVEWKIVFDKADLERSAAPIQHK